MEELAGCLHCSAQALCLVGTPRRALKRASPHRAHRRLAPCAQNQAMPARPLN